MQATRKRFHRYVCAWILALAFGLTALAATAVPALAVPAKFWGVVPQAPPTAEEFQRLKAGGVDSYRIPVVWEAIQPTKGAPFDWSRTDIEVAEATRAHLEVLPFVYGAPAWAVPSAFVPGSHRSFKAPAHLPVSGVGRAGWNAFLTAVVGRYGPNGSFWAQNPSVPKVPLRTWQIWNEENFKYFVVRPNPVEYGKLVKASYATIKAADPGARLILGGLFARPREAAFKVKPPQAYFATDFLEAMYEGNPGIKSKFVGIALHPYTTHYQRLAPELEEVRSVLKESGDGGKGIWITELGWSSGQPAPNNQFAKGPAGQAAQLKGAFTLLRQKQAKWKIQRVFWFSVDDRAASCNFCDGTGLFGPGFVPKKSWFEYVKFAGGTP